VRSTCAKYRSGNNYQYRFMHYGFDENYSISRHWHLKERRPVQSGYEHDLLFGDAQLHLAKKIRLGLSALGDSLSFPIGREHCSLNLFSLIYFKAFLK
jgi:hypothetical protein